jgi:signal transduction histidine kinase
MNALTYDPLTLAYHELRSPLGLVATAIRSVAEDSSDDVLRHRCEMIVRTVERMLRTTEQVFGLARTTISAEQESFAPAEVVAQVVSDFNQNGAPIETYSARAVTARTLGQRGTFEALIQSLLNNALDHSDPGAAIRVEVDAGEDTLSITISNPMATTRRHHGLGVGLYFCRRLAEQLGASLVTESEDGVFRATVQVLLTPDF